MSVSKEYVKSIEDLLCDLHELSTRVFFGGKSQRSTLYGEDTQFAMMLNAIFNF